MSDFNDQIIAEFRANRGTVSTYGFGDSLVILHSTGAKPGQDRVNPVMAIPTADGGWLVAASKAGAPEHPVWYLNLKAHPEATVETGTSTVPVIATDLTGEEYADAWGRFTAQSEAFSGYQEKAGDRVIPVIRLDPR